MLQTVPETEPIEGKGDRPASSSPAQTSKYKKRNDGMDKRWKLQYQRGRILVSLNGGIWSLNVERRMQKG